MDCGGACVTATRLRGWRRLRRRSRFGVRSTSTPLAAGRTTLAGPSSSRKTRTPRTQAPTTTPGPCCGRVHRHGAAAAPELEWRSRASLPSSPSASPSAPRRRRGEVRSANGLTIDRREAAALDRILAGCTSTALEPVVCAVPTGSSSPAGAATGGDALARYDDNGNGSITCAEARRHGIAPVPRSHPAYRYMRDGDGDGVVCE